MSNFELPARPFTTAQAREFGLDRVVLKRLQRRGEVRRVLRGVWVRSDVPDTFEIRGAAASLVVAPTVVLCDEDAAWVWGIDVRDAEEAEHGAPLQTHALRGGPRTRRAGCRRASRDLDEDRDVVVVGGLRVTTPLRTALDLACKLRRRAALATVDAFMRAHGITREEMDRELTRYFRRRGVVQAREIVALGDPRAESPGESWTRLEVHDHGLPSGTPNVWVYENGLAVYRLDLAWRRRKICVEYDGREHHGPKQKVHDDSRREWLRRRGWTVIVVRAEDFASEEAVLDWIAELREAMR